MLVVHSLRGEKSTNTLLLLGRYDAVSALGLAPVVTVVSEHSQEYVTHGFLNECPP